MGTIVEYLHRFEQLFNRELGLNGDTLLNCFIFGLFVDIRHEIAIHRPYLVHQAIILAHLIESTICPLPASAPDRASSIKW